MKIITKTIWNLPTFEELEKMGYSAKTEEELLELVCNLNEQELISLCGDYGIWKVSYIEKIKEN